MAPTKGKTGGKAGSPKGGMKKSQRPSQPGSSGGIRKKSSSKPTVKPKIVQQKTKSGVLVKKKQRKYTDKELGVPTLNGIVPSGVAKPANQKKGKNFVDDKESLNAILAIVMAEKEGNIESKMMRARQMEEIREARKAEAEKRVAYKKKGLEDRKQDIKETEKGEKKRRRSDGDSKTADAIKEKAKESKQASFKKPRKRVSFG